MQFAMVFYAAMGKHNHQKFEHGNESSGVWTLKHLEVLLLAATLLATVIISALTLHQTTQNFQIERTSSFVARFNSLEQVSLREAVDRWLESGESATNLYVRSDPVFFCPSNTTVIVDPTNREDALKTIAQLRTMANFFQEFGTALKFGSLDEQYAHQLLGAICVRYGDELEPFINQTRIIRKRSQAYAEVFWLRDRMKYLETHDK